MKTPEQLLKDIEDKIVSEIPQDDSTSREEKLILMQAILDTKPRVIVETGTHRGKTTVYMGLAAKEVGAQIHTFDPFEWGAYGNFSKFLDLPIIYYQKAGKLCDIKNIDFFFCDGWHEKMYVLEEIDAIFPNLSKKAVVYFHDTNGSNISCDVPGAIDERKLKVKYLKTLNGMAVYENINNNS